MDDTISITMEYPIIDYRICLNGLKQGCVILKNKLFLILFTVFSCGKVYALPQDWTCKDFVLNEYQRIENGEFTINSIYRGQDNDYALEVNMYWQAEKGIADCGTSGCLGTIKNTKTGKVESLRFFCEILEDKKYDKAKCYIGGIYEYIFNSDEKGNYIVHYCPDDMQKTLRFNKSNCDKCHCTMYRYDGKIKDKNSHYEMACKKEENKAHCFNYYEYEAWRNFENADND